MILKKLKKLYVPDAEENLLTASLLSFALSANKSDVRGSTTVLTTQAWKKCVLFPCSRKWTAVASAAIHKSTLPRQNMALSIYLSIMRTSRHREPCFSFVARRSRPFRQILTVFRVGEDAQWEIGRIEGRIGKLHHHLLRQGLNNHDILYHTRMYIRIRSSMMPVIYANVFACCCCIRFTSSQ